MEIMKGMVVGTYKIEHFIVEYIVGKRYKDTIVEKEGISICKG